MATPREIKKRIQAVSNTRKITRTMELVSTVKSKKLMDLLKETKKYKEALEKLLRGVLKEKEEFLSSWYFRTSIPLEKKVLWVFSANRGLCGAYNSNVLQKTEEFLQKEKDIEVYLIGKKAKSYFDYKGYPYKKVYVDIGENPRYSRAEEIYKEILSLYQEGKEIYFIHTHFYSAGKQRPILEKFLPLEISLSEEDTFPYAFIEPSWEEIERKLFPQFFKARLYQIFVEAALSEQIYRRIAMKNATDAAGEMIRFLRRAYNRARQEKITKEIAEIVGGAEAIS